MSATAPAGKSATTGPEWAPPRLPEHGVLGGVLAGVGWRIGIDPVLLRVGFAVLTLLTGGVAALLYAVAWIAVPTEGRIWSPRAERLWRSRNRPAFAAGVALVVLAALLGLRELGLWWGDAFIWPLVVAGFGVALLWRGEEADPGAAEVGRGRAWLAARSLYQGGFGAALVLGAALLFLVTNDVSGAAREIAFTAIAAVVALALIAAPFLWRLGKRLEAERAARIRSQEKAELAAHLHDSVLQTLTLIQKKADDPGEIAQLAGRQERELRRWLEGRSDPGAKPGFAAGLRDAIEGVEDRHGARIGLVTVGDRPLDAEGAAMIAAAREAATNAAKFGAPPISVYAEAAGEELEIWIRDRGPGFDPEAIPADRRGVRESILARMRRYGGEVEIRTGDGEGSEIALRLRSGGER